MKAHDEGKPEAAQRQVKSTRKLLERAIDAIPDYVDGRNDKLCNAIDRWLA